MGCTKSKKIYVIESSLSSETKDIITKYEKTLKKRRVSYPDHHIFLPQIRKRRRSRCNSY